MIGSFFVVFGVVLSICCIIVCRCGRLVGVGMLCRCVRRELMMFVVWLLWIDFSVWLVLSCFRSMVLWLVLFVSS